MHCLSDLTGWISYNIPSEINYITHALNISRLLVSRQREPRFAQLAAMYAVWIALFPFVRGLS